MCNPPKPTTLISECNVTGYWDRYRVDLLEACLRTPKSSITTPFKNYYCYLCNRNSTIESSKYLDAKMNISEMMIPINDERYFKFEFHIEALDIRFIKDKIINDIHLQDEFEKEKRTGKTFKWLQSPPVTPPITEPTGIKGPLPKSFREIFALEVFDDLQDNKMDKECNKTQIFDELKLFRKAIPPSSSSSTSNTTRGNIIDTTTTSLIDASKTEVDVHVKTEALMSAK
ncbi:unnamed protein product [Mytilus edulis]|uniref:Uncharacterized protein n=1 Tax=Mytilus edulis TaxID=6550 RepID=A0A8S3PMI4_MYTED|nr:unnamed protein product [Mytilus edulis]